MNRRGFLTGLTAAFAAPAIVRAGILMPIKPSLVPPDRLVTMPFWVVRQWMIDDLAALQFDTNALMREHLVALRVRAPERYLVEAA